MDDDKIMDTLTAAFLDDPLYRWLYPDDDVRPLALRDNLRLTLSLCRDRGRVDTIGDADGIALWSDPGVELLDDPAPFLDSSSGGHRTVSKPPWPACKRAAHTAVPTTRFSTSWRWLPTSKGEA